MSLHGCVFEARAGPSTGVFSVKTPIEIFNVPYNGTWVSHIKGRMQIAMLKKKALMIFRPKRQEVTETGEDCTMRRSIFFTPHHKLFG